MSANLSEVADKYGGEVKERFTTWKNVGLTGKSGFTIHHLHCLSPFQNGHLVYIFIFAVKAFGDLDVN